MSNQVLAVREQILADIEGRTLLDVYMATCDANGGRPALVVKDGEEFVARSWSEYRHEASQIAMALRRAGVGHGDVVTLMMTNRPEHVIADVATLLAGGVPVSVYNTFTAEQLGYIAGDCRAKVAIVEDAAFLAKWDTVRGELPDLELVVVLDADGVEDDRNDVISYAQLLADGAAALPDGQGELENSWRAVRPDDPVTVIYTSGTTGHPKGVVITHEGLLYQLSVTQRLFDVQPGQRGLSYLPLAHIAERMVTHYLGIRYAGTTFFVRDVSEVLETLQQARPQLFMAVPRVWEKMHTALMGRIAATDDPRRRKLAEKALEVAIANVGLELAGDTPSLQRKLQHALFDRLVFSRIRDGLGLDELRYAISAAAPISTDLLVFFKAIGIEILEVYGMTESTAVITANAPGRTRIGTVGQPVPGVELRIADDGEILTRGPHVMPGYLNRPEATAEAIDADGWLHTGDLGRMDADGYLKVVGRKKELIITAGGKNLSPSNIEETIKQRSPLIGQLCAVGDRRPYVAALVVLDADALPAWCDARGLELGSVAEAADHPEVIAEVQRAIDEGNERLARVEQVRRWQIVPAEWTAESAELTPSLKLKRDVIHSTYQDVIEGLYAESA